MNRQLCKITRQAVQNDIDIFNEKQLLHTIEKRKKIKDAVKKIDIGKKKLTCIKEENGSPSYDKQHIADRFSEYYSDQFSSTQPIVNTVLSFQKINEKDSSILKFEVQRAIQKLKIKTSPGEDMVTNASLKLGGDTIVETLTELYNKCLEEEKVVSSWMKAIVVLIHKKGDTTEVSNYRPLSLLSSLSFFNV